MTNTSRLLAAVAAVLTLAGPALASEFTVIPAVHEDLPRAFDDLAGQLHGLGARVREHFGGPDRDGERPLITIALGHRAELGLSPQQVEALERLRADFSREAVKRDADLRVAEMDLETLRRADPVDLARVEAKVREIERARADLRVARIRTIEQGKAQLTAEQREKLRMLAAEPRPLIRPRAGTPPRERF
jgi:hypothetical protein